MWFLIALVPKWIIATISPTQMKSKYIWFQMESLGVCSCNHMISA